MNDSFNKTIPVILDTDIGDDMDDTWALAMMLNSPELDVKLVVSAVGDTLYRAKLIGKLLETARRMDISVGIGIREKEDGANGRQAAWVKDYDLRRYPGKVHEDGVQAMIDVILAASGPVTLISIGPTPNIAQMLRREPRVAGKCRFVGMHGSIRRGYDGREGAAAEYNVKADIPSCQAVFAAPWREMTITPLDTCGVVRLKGEKYRMVCGHRDPLVRAVIENYRIWLGDKPDEGRSSILYDTVAIYLAFADQLLAMERMGIKIDDEGFTRQDSGGASVKVAMDWKDLGAFEDFLVERLTR